MKVSFGSKLNDVSSSGIVLKELSIISTTKIPSVIFHTETLAGIFTKIKEVFLKNLKHKYFMENANY